MARSRRQDASPDPDSRPEPCGDEGGAADLSFNEARAALELVLAGLYQRGRTYAQRCEAILDQVEQEVLIWDDLANPDGAPVRYDPELDPA
jgi:hypothetical protein